MKKLLLVFSVLLCGLSAVFADEYVISHVECIEPVGLYDRELTLKYEDSKDVYYLCRSTYSSTYWFTLSPEKLERLRTTLDKVQDWRELARENKSSIQKELPDSEISVEGAMKSGNEWYTTRWDIGLNFFFVSQVSDTMEMIGLLVRGGEAESRQNQFIDIEFESVVFLNDEIDALVKAISPETVQAAKDEHEKAKKTADMFN